jgi:hypothetical protein
MVQVLNLRKREREASKEVKPNQAAKKSVIPLEKDYKVNKSSPSPEQQKPQISWQAPSFYFKAEKKYLYLTILGLALSGGALLFFNKDTLTAIFLILSSLVLILHSTKKPEIYRITLNQRGLAINEAMYYYKDLKSFWIHYNPGNIKELSIESKRWYMPYIRVSIEKENPLDIRSFLVGFLPEREQEQSLIDIISRTIGL